MIGRAPGATFHQLSKQRRERLSAAIRALDAHSAGRSYRVIAEALFCKKRVLLREPGRRMICAIEQSAWCKAASR
ncbi:MULTISPECIES: DNA -binding domain-containing protein [Bradyrhizobium]|uniref:DNA -binding domain-containing protein n=1 Tax=Bradyrhizobium TaxID=374 RepID=UPI0030B8153E